MDELGRFRVLNAKPVNLDGFSVADPDLGLVAMHSPDSRFTNRDRPT